MLDVSANLYDSILCFQNFLEKIKDENFNKDISSIKFKILFLVYKNKQLSPTNLSNILGMAKSNVALFCKQLLQDQCIISRIDELDHRIIYYCLTKKGEKFVIKKLETLSQNLQTNFSDKEIREVDNCAKKLAKTFQTTGE